MKQKEPIPVTVLTGFLGAGKTTLLNHLLTQKHGYKCAIIINEYGSISIDHQLVVGADEEIVELNNGCLCCRVRGDLIKSLNSLFQRQKRFDYVLVETTGLADPGPVAQTFGLPELAGKLRLDGIVTVADAKHLEKELKDAPEATPQIAFADVIMLNKVDLVAPDELRHVEARIRRINPLARIYHTQRSQIDVGLLLNLKARDVLTPLQLASSPPQGPDHHHHHHHDHECDHGCDHDHGHDHQAEADHRHDESVSSFYIEEDRPLDLQKTEKWLGDLVNDLGARIYRSKGILHIKGQAKRIVFQGVQMMFEAVPDRFWDSGEKKRSQLVFIGRNLDVKVLRSGFESCLAD
ncbi:MAG: GTP-binding protein [Opitutaceae bacterium]|nr:GTP-binding protein [Verrucomicrobiales bacterium]